MATATPELDLGKLLRVRALVIGAAQVEATYNSAGALVRAYLALRKEMLLALKPKALSDLLAEFRRLFPDMDVPEPHDPRMDRHLTSAAQLTDAATEALLNLRRLEGWIQGLIDEATLSERLRLDAEANAAQANRPQTGFQP